MLQLSWGWLKALSHQAGTFSAAVGLSPSPVHLASLGTAALIILHSLLQPPRMWPLRVVCDSLLCSLHPHLFFNAICFLSALHDSLSAYLTLPQLPSCFSHPSISTNNESSCCYWGTNYSGRCRVQGKEKSIGHEIWFLEPNGTTETVTIFPSHASLSS